MAHYEYGKGLRGSVRRRQIKKLQKVILIVGIFVVIAVVAGAVYTWIMGQQAKNTRSETTTKTTPQMAKPLKRDLNAPVGVSIQTMNSPITPGENAILGVHTTPGATCVIKVEYNKIPITDSGIIDKVADDYGIASWSWSVPSDAPIGKWPVDITCTYGKQSGYMHGDLEIKKKEL